jgi:NAD(P)-dependent dehydrogenase (short-subunit alcohol dehydrogenase family)
VSSLSGKSIVVTGGNSGISKAIVLAAAAAGADGGLSQSGVGL